jgi:hypothetical protein
LQQKEELDIQLQEVDDSIALLKLLSNTSTKQCTATFHLAHMQTEVHLPLSQHLMTTPLTRLQVEEEERKKRIVKSFRKK